MYFVEVSLHLRSAVIFLRSPDDFSDASAAFFPVSPVWELLSPPHPASNVENAITPASANAAIFFAFIFFLL